MSFIAKKIEGLRLRLRCMSLGIFYLTSKKFRIPRKLFIQGAFREFIFNHRASNAFVYEFREICLQDCYELRALKKKLNNVRSIVDIGANQGLFLIAARKCYSKAAIAGYEPNPHLRQVLAANSRAVGAAIFPEAVMRQAGHVELDFSESDLHTTTRLATAGTIPAVSLPQVIERAGGQIDILKLDCEGCEWQLFEDLPSWKQIRSVTMEYHLWAKAGSSRESVKTLLDRLGYNIIADKPLSEKFGLITAIKK